MLSGQFERPSGQAILHAPDAHFIVADKVHGGWLIVRLKAGDAPHRQFVALRY